MSVNESPTPPRCERCDRADCRRDALNVPLAGLSEAEQRAASDAWKVADRECQDRAVPAEVWRARAQQAERERDEALRDRDEALLLWRTSDRFAAVAAVVQQRDTARAELAALRADLARLQSEAERMREAIEAFADTAERAVANHRRPKGGMQVPYHDDFANITPSVVGRLEWWARRLRAALAPVEAGGKDTDR